MNDKIVSPISVRKPARYRGMLGSQDFNDFQEFVVNDVQDLGKAVNTLYNQLTKTATILHNENAYLRQLVDVLMKHRQYVEQADGGSGFGVNRFIGFGDTRGITFPGGLNDQYSAMLAAQFGEVTLPANAIENRFYTTSIRTGKVVTAPDLVVKVNPSFDKGDGEGLVNYERGGKVTLGEPTYAFNGNNQSYWMRRVEFPIDSRVDQVEVELTVDVPDGTSSEANLIEIYPFPNGSVDLTSVSTASSTADTFTLLSGFSAVNNVSFKRYHFPVTRIERVKIRLRQRNWVEENGKKVFYYGLQELGLKLVDYDKTFRPAVPFGENPSFLLQVDAPAGFGFTNLFRIAPSPDFTKEDTGKRHVRLRITTDATLSTFLWDSDSSLTPQEAGQAFNLGTAQTIYCAFEMKFVQNTGGSLSPYPVGTTPYLNGLGLSYTLGEL